MRVEQMLPIVDLDPNEADEEYIRPLIETSRDEILEQLLPQFAESMIRGHHRCQDSWRMLQV